MAERRYCNYCGKEVRPKHEPRQDEDGRVTAVQLHCPDCGHHLATDYGHVPIQ